MLLGGGSSCQQCGCGESCPECTHFSADDYLDGSTVSITVDGNAISSVPTSSSSYTVTPPGIVTTTCGMTGAIKRARFGYEYISGEFSEDDDTSGCFVRRVYAYLYARLEFSGECTYEFRLRVHRNTGECTDTGGTAVVGAWAAYQNTCGFAIPEDCVIDALDWLSTLSVSASFSYAACECPP